MEIFLIKALQLILALSILVLVHEFGHFLFARIFKVRVEKFYLFFDWKFSLFKWKPKNSDTEYGVGWVPLGGYCKIAGMIDESMDTEQMKQPAQPWEYRSKPAWQRLLIIVGGVLFNLILALFIYSMVLFTWGNDYTDLHKMKNGFEFNETAKEIGFRNGDMIVKIDGNEVHEFYFDIERPECFDKVRGAELFRQICGADTVTVLRDGGEVNIGIPGSLGLLNMNKPTAFMVQRIPTVIGYLDKDGAAAKAGMVESDRIITIDNRMINSWAELKTTMKELEEEKKTTFDIEFQRNGNLIKSTATVDSTYMLGVAPEGNNYPIEHISYAFFESFPAGVSYAMEVLRGYVSDFQYVFTSEGSKSVGMFGSIGSMFPDAWDWHEFWLMTAFLSIVLAFMNILPIPALDGGHALFLIYEMITGKQPSDKFMERAQMVGMLIILGLFVLATYNDLMKFIF